MQIVDGKPKFGFRIYWKRIPGVLADRFNRKAMAVRVWWDRKVLKRTNPYI
jgi:hypothetical protein